MPTVIAIVQVGSWASQSIHPIDPFDSSIDWRSFDIFQHSDLGSVRGLSHSPTLLYANERNKCVAEEEKKVVSRKIVSSIALSHHHHLHHRDFGDRLPNVDPRHLVCLFTCPVCLSTSPFPLPSRERSVWTGLGTGRKRKSFPGLVHGAPRIHS